jgi:hypothetical protein
MALGLTQPLTEMSTTNLPVGKGGPARKAQNLTAICEPTVYKMWEPRRLTTLWASAALYRNSFTIFMAADVKVTGFWGVTLYSRLHIPVSGGTCRHSFWVSEYAQLGKNSTYMTKPSWLAQNISLIYFSRRNCIRKGQYSLLWPPHSYRFTECPYFLSTLQLYPYQTRLIRDSSVGIAAGYGLYDQ